MNQPDSCILLHFLNYDATIIANTNFCLLMTLEELIICTKNILTVFPEVSITYQKSVINYDSELINQK